MRGKLESKGHHIKNKDAWSGKIAEAEKEANSLREQSISIQSEIAELESRLESTNAKVYSTEFKEIANLLLGHLQKLGRAP